MTLFIPAAPHDLFEMTERTGESRGRLLKSCSLIQFAVRLRGSPDTARLALAAERAAEVLPILSCRFSAEQRGWVPLEHPQYLEEVEAPIEKYYTTSFSAETHQPLRLLYSREENILLASIDHGAADAHGFAAAVYLILTLYRLLKKNPDLHIPQAAVADRTYDRILSAYSNEELRSLTAAELEKAAAGKAAANVFLPDPSTGREKLFLRVISPDAFWRIHAYAKKHGATINDMLIAADCAVLLDYAEQRGVTLTTIPIRIAADLRRYLPVTAGQKLAAAGMLIAPAKYMPDFLQTTGAMMNYSVPVWLPVPVSGGHDFLSLLQDAVRASRAFKTAACGIGAAAWIERRFTGLPDAFSSSELFQAPFVSNAGVIRKEMLNFGDGVEIEEILPFAYFNSGYQFSLGAVTWNNQLTLSTVADAESKTCPEILEKIAAILESV